MTRSREERMLAFVEGRMEAAERTRFLEEIEADPELAREVQTVAGGLAMVRDPHVVQALSGLPVDAGPGDVTLRHRPRRTSPWALLVSAAAALVLAVPMTWRLATARAEAVAVDGSVVPAASTPVAPEGSYLLVLQGLWPDAETLTPQERNARASEYWQWAVSLAERDVLLAAGDLAWEPGRFLEEGGVVSTAAEARMDRPDFMVGMFALRADSYEEAVAIALSCPHLRYGGTVSVRQGRVAAGFVRTGTDAGAPPAEGQQ